MAEVDDAKDRLQSAVDALEAAVGEVAGADVRSKVADLEQGIEKMKVDLDTSQEQNDAVQAELEDEKQQAEKLRDAVIAAAKTVDRLVEELNKLL